MDLKQVAETVKQQEQAAQLLLQRVANIKSSKECVELVRSHAPLQQFLLLIQQNVPREGMEFLARARLAPPFAMNGAFMLGAAWRQAELDAERRIILVGG